MSQLFSVSFTSTTQSVHIDKRDSNNVSSTNIQNGPISFRPIISRVLSQNFLSSTNDTISQLLNSNTSSSLFNGDQSDYSITYRSLS